MTQHHAAVRVAGTWFAVASFLMVAVLVSHGPLAHDLDHQMERIANGAMRWTMVHWVAAAALSLHAITGLVVLASGSRLTEDVSTMTAWALLVVSALWVITTAVAEATVVTSAAMSGDEETFKAWWSFAEGMGSGFAIFALAVAAIAASEARQSKRALPVWAARVGVVAGLASFAGWALGRWFGVPFGNLLWVAASVVMSLWTLWFGVALIAWGLESDRQADARSATLDGTEGHSHRS
jgi:hypothetical protein